MSEENTITFKKDTLWKGAAVVFAVLFVVAILGGFNFGGDSGTGAAVDDQRADAQQDVNAKSLIESNDPVLGNPDAEVSIIEFSDFQCPYCTRVSDGALTDFKASSYFTDGQVNLIYKHLPLSSIHPFAQKAAEASLCAQDQDAFWEYHDVLFANQNALDSTSLVFYATQLGLDSGEFETCLTGGEKASEVNKELAQATSAGARGTPFFVVVNTETGDATSISGAVPFAQFEAAINAVL